MSEKKPIDRKLFAWRIACIVITVIFVPVIVLNMFFLISTLVYKDRVPTLCGYGTVMVLSDSMKGEFETDDAIFIKRVEDVSTLQVGDIICYREDDTFVTHRIDSIATENGERVFITKGDQNNTVDRGNATAEEIQGIYVGTASGLFGVINFLQSPLGVMLVVIIPCLVYARYEVYLWQKKKQEELECVQRELEDTKQKLKITEELLAATRLALVLRLMPETPQEPIEAPVVTPVEEITPAPAEEPAAAETTEGPAEAPVAPFLPIEDGDGDSATVTDAWGRTYTVRYRKSFTAKLIQSDAETQSYYGELKNEILSYKKVKDRMSWHCETFKYAKEKLIKIAIRGKTLMLYLALDPAEFPESKYHHTDVSDTSRYADVPFALRIRSDRAIKYAKELIAVLMERKGAVQSEVPTVDYSLPYEPNAPLLARGLIKIEGELPDGLAAPAEVPVEPVAETPVEEVPLESVEVPVAEIPTEEAEDEPFSFTAQYDRSFMSRLIQGGEQMQALYTAVKNKALGFAGVKCRINWSFESFTCKRTPVLKLRVRGKSLYAYLPLTAEEQETYRVDRMEDSAKYAATPAVIKVTGRIKLGRVLRALEAVCARLGLTEEEALQDVYSYPYMDDERLLMLGLITPAEEGEDDTPEDDSEE